MMDILPGDLIELLRNALKARESMIAPPDSASRLFNGFLEGFPRLSVDLFGETLVLYDYANPPQVDAESLNVTLNFYRQNLPWLRCGLLKRRFSAEQEERRGVILFGTQPDKKICENGVWYALNLQLNQDASFYMDTRQVRAWLKANLTGLSVLNTFAYTGSLGAAALAGGAQRVVQLDINRVFLNIAKETYTLNGFPIHNTDFIVGDYFRHTSRLRRNADLFDCVIFDPPFFSVTAAGRVNLVQENMRILNKVRPLVADGGWLIAINNALFVSGVDYLHMLQQACADGYLALEEIIPVPPDITGFSSTVQGTLPADPAPFNHATKIALLRVRRKNKVGK
jgi:23S rRNA (cytosine1962-C5)-methyltransferase